ncbi:MAG: extracellular solute-binding protein [Epibacterium sp.]|nr:extracellular solute-binding protein [Epibacterium sp.]
MRHRFFTRLRTDLLRIALLASSTLAASESFAAPQHGIAMYGEPALAADFDALPYVNPDAPKGGTVVFGNTGGFDTLNPFVQKGTPPWQIRFWGYEGLMGRSFDEPFTLYGLLAETIETAEDRSWVQFTLRPEAKFWDGSQVTVEDVIWSYETLGTDGNLRYRGLWSQISSIEAVDDRTVRLSFTGDNRELALIAGLRPILKKAQWDGRSFAEAPSNEEVIGTGPYRVTDFEFGRQVTFMRDPNYWGKDLPLRRGTNNLDEIKLEFFGDQTVLFESLKAGELSAMREFNAHKWDTAYDFDTVLNGSAIKTEIPNQKPSGMTGIALNTRHPALSDWRVREALIQAFNFEFINETITGSRLPRITSYFSNSYLAMDHNAASGKVLELLEPFASDLHAGTLEGYNLPVSDGNARNRTNLRNARKLLEDAGWSVKDGVLRNATGEALELSLLIKHGNLGEEEVLRAAEIYAPALERLGIKLTVDLVDSAQYLERQNAFEFDLTFVRRALSLSPGTEQYLYWGTDSANTQGSRNLMGVQSPAVDAMIDAMLSARTKEDFIAATKALDRVLTAGRYVIPIWHYSKSRILHDASLRYPNRLPIYGDGYYFMPEVWWYQRP